MKKANRLSLILLTICVFLTSNPQYLLASPGIQVLGDKIDAYIEQHEDTTAAVATIVMYDSEILVHRITGYADLERSIKADKDTVFEWGSCSKILIWISVMQLVEDGLIDLNIDIGEYLPQDFKYPISFDEPITMINLMNHDAGFDDSYTDLMIPDTSEMISLRQALEQMNVQQEFRPADLVAYSNYGSALAAYIVEVVSGVDYRKYVKENIFIPLGMADTSIDPQQKDNLWVKEQREKIQGYTADNNLIYPNYRIMPMYPAGSAIGTADDFAKLLTVLLSENGNPLFKNKETIELMFEPTAYFPGTDIPRISHGLFSLPAQGQVYGHGGNTVAFSSSIYLDRENKLGLIVMTNQWRENNFCLGIPELVFDRKEYISSKGDLEDSSLWEGIYQPARMPYHGFSKVYSLLNRGKVKSQGNQGLKTNKLYYTQHRPGIYITGEDYSIYSQDVYSTHPRFEKILSSTYTDLIYIPLYQHIFELCLIIVGGIAIIFSLIFVIARLIKKKINFITIQNILHLVLVINVIWMSKKALSMTSYNSLKINFWINILYMFIIIPLCGYSIYKQKSIHFSKWQKTILLLTIISSLVLFINLVYWEFYH